jgi:S-adenosylmethionine decarboxylase
MLRFGTRLAILKSQNAIFIYEGMLMKSLGNHLIIELYDCNVDIINDLHKVENILMESVIISGAEIITPVFHKFNPHGVSGVIVIAESHFSIHTWPEYGYCAVDIFTCGNTIDSQKALTFMKKAFEAKSISVVETKRGILNLPIEKIKYKPEKMDQNNA